jgi:hypothetical protein
LPFYFIFLERKGNKNAWGMFDDGEQKWAFTGRDATFCVSTMVFVYLILRFF